MMINWFDEELGWNKKSLKIKDVSDWISFKEKQIAIQMRQLFAIMCSILVQIQKKIFQGSSIIWILVWG